MKTTINLGKIAYNNQSRRVNLVTIDIELTKRIIGETISHEHLDTQESYVLLMSGNIWNGSQTDIILGGQCLDEIAAHFPKCILTYRLHWLWKNYHLNHMNAGCIHQKTGNFFNDSKISKQVCKETGYKYGSKWLFKIIPDDIIEEIKLIITANNGSLENE